MLEFVTVSKTSETDSTGSIYGQLKQISADELLIDERMTEGEANRTQQKIWIFWIFWISWKSERFPKNHFMLFFCYLRVICVIYADNFSFCWDVWDFLSLTIAIMAIIAIMYSGVTRKSIPHVSSLPNHYLTNKLEGFLCEIVKIIPNTNSNHPPFLTFISVVSWFLSLETFSTEWWSRFFCAQLKKINKQSYIIFGYCRAYRIVGIHISYEMIRKLARKFKSSENNLSELGKNIHYHLRIAMLCCFACYTAIL